MNTSLPTVGVVVGRFQVARLHKGHRHLIDTARAANDKLLIVVDCAGFPTPRNPLTYPMCHAMIRHDFPTATVCKLEDHPSDNVWSESLDALMATTFPGYRVVLYGSRDSFIPRYNGVHTTIAVEGFGRFSGTATRRRIASKILSSPAFRAGVIHNFVNRLAVTRPMVDIAIVREDKVLLGGKNTDPSHLWRFGGGLVDQTDPNLEFAALREQSEEFLGIEVTAPTYIGSTQIEDWRYENSGETGMTTLFRTDYVSGIASPGDDLDRIAWKNISELPACLVPEHISLGHMLLKSLGVPACEPVSISL